MYQRYLTYLLGSCVALLLTACSSSHNVPGPERAADPPAAPAHPAGFANLLPAPSTLDLQSARPRKTSFTEDDLILLASSFEPTLPHNRVIPIGDASAFKPAWSATSGFSLDGLAYAMYICNAVGYDRGSHFDYRWNTLPTNEGDVWFGLANWDRDSWDWYQGNNNHHIVLPPIDRYFNPNANLLLTVVEIGDDENSMSRIHIGNQVPTADINPASTFGVAPLTVNFSAGASTDPEGDIFDYEWDFDGDGSFDQLSTDPQISHEYTDPGDFQPRVRVRDEDLIFSGTTSGELHVIAANRFSYGSPNFQDSGHVQLLGADHGIITLGQRDGGGMTTVLITKVTPEGEGVYAKSWAGVGSVDTIDGAAMDSGGSIYACGLSWNADHQPEGLVQKWSQDGELIWSKVYESIYNSAFKDIAVNGSTVYVCGQASDTTEQRALLVALDTDGNVQWSKYLCDIDTCEFTGLIYRNQGQFFAPLRCCGSYIKHDLANNRDMLYATFDTDGSVDATMTLGSTDADESARSMVLAGVLASSGTFILGSMDVNHLLFTKVGGATVEFATPSAGIFAPLGIQSLGGNSIRISAEATTGFSFGAIIDFDTDLNMLAAAQLGTDSALAVPSALGRFGLSNLGVGFSSGEVPEDSDLTVGAIAFGQTWQTVDLPEFDLSFTPVDTSLTVTDLTGQFEINRGANDSDVYIELRAN